MKKNIFNLQTFHCKNLTKSCHSEVQISEVPRSAGFTLAEVLITLGVIGVVAAMTIPGLMNTYKKKQYYTQFMKARSVIENTLRMYANDNDCEIADGSCDFKKSENVEKLGRYFKGVQYITEDNCTKLLSGYDKMPIKRYDKQPVDEPLDSEYFCEVNSIVDSDIKGFTTIDGMMLNFDQDDGYGLGITLDVNGPNSGPNVYGRDIFVFYTDSVVGEYFCNSIWGMSKACKEKNNLNWGAECYNGNFSSDCGARLIEEGKMNY
ncbi:type II secretion system protein [bacterium]|nr:type II secretion system protein [bacterium]